jgi:hypothetical protein
VRLSIVTNVAILILLALIVIGCNRKPMTLDSSTDANLSDFWIVQSGDSLRLDNEFTRLQLDTPLEVHWSASGIGPIVVKAILSFDECSPHYGCGVIYRDCPNVEFNVSGAGRHGIAVSGLPGGRKYFLSVIYGTDINAVIECHWLDLSSRPNSGDPDSVEITAL